VSTKSIAKHWENNLACPACKGTLRFVDSLLRFAIIEYSLSRQIEKSQKIIQGT